MAMNDQFRSWAINLLTKETILQKSCRDYFVPLFDESTYVALARLCQGGGEESKGPGMRFITLIHREDNVKEWVKFIEHEQIKQESPWKNEAFKDLPTQLNDWISNFSNTGDHDPVVSSVEKGLVNVTAPLDKDKYIGERIKIGLQAFRTMLWRLQGEKL